MQSINEYCETLINAKRYEIMTETVKSVSKKGIQEDITSSTDISLYGKNLNRYILYSDSFKNDNMVNKYRQRILSDIEKVLRNERKLIKQIFKPENISPDDFDNIDDIYFDSFNVTDSDDNSPYYLYAFTSECQMYCRVLNGNIVKGTIEYND